MDTSGVVQNKKKQKKRWIHVLSSLLGEVNVIASHTKSALDFVVCTAKLVHAGSIMINYKFIQRTCREESI